MIGPVNIPKCLLDDCILSVDDLVRMITKPKPSRPPIVQPEPSIEFKDAASALRALLEAGCDATDGPCDDRVCFYCGSMLEYEPHSNACSYIAAKVLVEK